MTRAKSNKLAASSPLQPIANGNAPANRGIQDSWHSTVTDTLKPYDATQDPFCPYTHTKKFKEQMKRKELLEEKTKGNQMSQSMTLSEKEATAFRTSMKEMERPNSAPQPEKFPKHQVAVTSMKTGGLTFSIESRGSAAEGQAELEVLKVILNREGYLSRLEQSIKKIGRKFKPEIADILDFIRAASIDVVEAIIRWREAKVSYHINNIEHSLILSYWYYPV